MIINVVNLLKYKTFPDVLVYTEYFFYDRFADNATMKQVWLCGAFIFFQFHYALSSGSPKNIMVDIED